MGYIESLVMNPDAHARLGQAQGNGIQLDFSVSQNEEHVSIALATPACRIDLGERTHHYSLLALARQRLQDAERGFDLSSQGWVETHALAQGLGIDTAHLNIHIFRARSQFRRATAQAGQMLELIERRRYELRIGGFDFQIRRGLRLEADFHLHPVTRADGGTLPSLAIPLRGTTPNPEMAHP